MPKGHISSEYYDDPDDFDAHDEYGADDDAFSSHEDDDYEDYDDYGEYIDDDPYRERLEVAPDDAEAGYEVFDEVYQKATTQAETKLDRPKRRRSKAQAPQPPGRLRAFWLRRKRSALRAAALAVLSGVVVVAFVYFWERPASNEFSMQAPSIAPPVVRCGDDSGAWPRDVPLTGHTIPALIKNEVSWLGERHGYQFYGEAGEEWRITAEARGESMLDPLIRLFDQSGREVAVADDRAPGDFTAELTFVLPQDGAYCVLVESAQGGLTTGAYWLSAWYVE